MKKIHKDLVSIILIVAYFLIIYLLEPIIGKNIKMLTGITIIAVISIGIMCLHKRKKLNIKNIIIIAIIIGILIRGMYIVYTPYTERQHDVYELYHEGHLGYIYRIYETGKLPETNNIQFYHPPLFHLIGAGWLRINTLLGGNINRAIEGIQVITAIFSSLILICSYKITEKLKIKDIYKLLINFVMIFHPTFIILSGSINNDILMILLNFIIILYLIKWDEQSNIKNTIILAISTGLAVMTKVSAAIMAVPILYVFIKKYLGDAKKNNKIIDWSLVRKISLFAIISLPIGLWHPIRNLILFNQSFGGILIPSKILDVSKYSILSRFFSLSFRELFLEPFAVLPGDHNILAYIIKTSVLGEFSYKNMYILATIMKLINLYVILFSIICTLMQIFSKQKENKAIINILIIMWFTNIISYYVFNVEYPYACTMDFRYLVPTIFTGIVCICNTLDSTKNKVILKEKKDNIMIILVFCLCSLGMFFVI